MLSKEDFTRTCTEFPTGFSSFLIIGRGIDEVFDVLVAEDENMCAVNAEETDGNTYFDAFGVFPDLVYTITGKLHTTGYANTGWDATYTICAKNGDDFEGYIAEWSDGSAPDYGTDEIEGDNGEYDAFVTITDTESGAVFKTGGGCVSRDEAEAYEDMVQKHSAVKGEGINPAVRTDYYEGLSDFLEEYCYDRDSGDAYLAYIVAQSRACRRALSDAMKYMFEKDPCDTRIQVAYAISEVLENTDALWEDYCIGTPLNVDPLIDEGCDISDEPANLLKRRIASFPKYGIGGICGGNEPADWIKEIIDSGDFSRK